MSSPPSDSPEPAGWIRVDVPEVLRSLGPWTVRVDDARGHPGEHIECAPGAHAVVVSTVIRTPRALLHGRVQIPVAVYSGATITCRLPLAELLAALGSRGRGPAYHHPPDGSKKPRGSGDATTGALRQSRTPALLARYLGEAQRGDWGPGDSTDPARGSVGTEGRRPCPG
jgi:hypothetical protein